MTKNTEYGKFLYLGCGHHRMPKFTHVEMNIGKNKSGPPDIIANITQHINLPDNSVDLIFSRATMEHLTYPELINCLLENFRLLRKDGVVRMLVPDFDIMIHDYLNRLPPPPPGGGSRNGKKHAIRKSHRLFCCACLVP